MQASASAPALPRPRKLSDGSSTSPAKQKMSRKNSHRSEAAAVSEDVSISPARKKKEDVLITAEQQRLLHENIQQQHERYTLKRRKWEFLHDYTNEKQQEKLNAASRTGNTLVNNLQKKVEQEMVDEYMCLEAFRLAKEAHKSKKHWVGMEERALALNRAKERLAMKGYKGAVVTYDKGLRFPDTLGKGLAKAKAKLTKSLAQANDQAKFRANMYNMDNTPIPTKLLQNDAYKHKYSVKDTHFEQKLHVHRQKFFNPHELTKSTHIRRDARALQLRNETKKINTAIRLPQAVYHASWAKTDPIKIDDADYDDSRVGTPQVCDLRVLPPIGVASELTKKDTVRVQASSKEVSSNMQTFKEMREMSCKNVLERPQSVQRNPAVARLLDKAKGLKSMTFTPQRVINDKPIYKPFLNTFETGTDIANSFHVTELKRKREKIEDELLDSTAALVKLGVGPEDIKPEMLDDSDLSPRSQAVRKRREMLRTRGHDIPSATWLRKHEMPPWRRIEPMERARRQVLFSNLDNDGNGVLDIGEIARALKMVGVKLSHEELEEVWGVIAASMDAEEVTFQEFTNEFHTRFENERLFKLYAQRKEKTGEAKAVLPIRLWAPAYHRLLNLRNLMKQYPEDRHAHDPQRDDRISNVYASSRSSYHLPPGLPNMDMRSLAEVVGE